MTTSPQEAFETAPYRQQTISYKYMNPLGSTLTHCRRRKTDSSLAVGMTARIWGVMAEATAAKPPLLLPPVHTGRRHSEQAKRSEESQRRCGIFCALRGRDAARHVSTNQQTPYFQNGIPLGMHLSVEICLLFACAFRRNATLRNNGFYPFRVLNGIGRFLPKALPLGWDITRLSAYLKWLKTIYSPAQWQRLGEMKTITIIRVENPTYNSRHGMNNRVTE